MPTASYAKFQPAVEALVEGINAGTDSWAIKLATAIDADLVFVMSILAEV